MRPDLQFKLWPLWDESLRFHALICGLPSTNAQRGDYASPSTAFNRISTTCKSSGTEWLISGAFLGVLVCVFTWERLLKIFIYLLWFIQTELSSFWVSSLPLYASQPCLTSPLIRAENLDEEKMKEQALFALHRVLRKLSPRVHLASERYFYLRVGAVPER